MFPFTEEAGPPTSMWDLLIMPLLFTFFGVAARIGAAQYQRNFGKRTKHAWYVYPPLAIALTYGLHWIYQLWLPNELSRMVYLNAGLTGRVRYAHYVAFLLPLIALIGVLVYDRRSQPRGGVRAAG